MNHNTYIIEQDPQKVLEKLKSKFSINLFKSLLLFDENQTEIYGKILSTGKEEPRQISIISQKMMDYDKAFLNFQEELPDKLNRSDYHPYACEFFVTNWKTNDEKRKKLAGKWFSVKLVFGELMKKCKCQGILVFSASPILRIKCGIEFFDNRKTIQDTDIEEYVHDNINAKRNDIRKDFLKGIEKVSGSIYNVGQGNFVHLNFNDNISMLFDVGEAMIPNGVLKEPEIIEANIEEIKTLEPNYIVLSHWDMDHILGIQHFAEIEGESSFFKTPIWVAPNIRLLDDKNGKCGASIYAQRVCVYLLELGHLRLMNQPNNLCISSNFSKLCLYQGACTQNPGSKANNIGLILQLEVHQKRFLFAGDCSYWKMRNLIDDNKKYDFIVSSHHGAASAVKNRQSCIAPKANEGAKAIISSGSNTHRHPHIEHLAVLQKEGFKILFTAGYKKIDFFLSEEGELNVDPIPYRSNESL